MPEKVFRDNKNREKRIVTEMIKKALRTDDLYFIPAHPYDLNGHADGMVRFYDDSSLLINEFTESPSWTNRFNRAILKTGLKPVPFPYKQSCHKSEGEWTAHGCYISFAQSGKLIIFPQFGGEFSESDKTALNSVKELYPSPEYNVETIKADSIAWHGGVLNCCTWNISRSVVKNAIDKIRPVYKSGDLMLVMLEDDYSENPMNDTVCIKLSLTDAKHLPPWSLGKHLKFGDGFYNIETKDEISEIRRHIASKFDDIDISDMYSKLKNPSADVISELVSIPERLKKQS